MKLTITPALTTQAMKAMAATIKAVHAANALNLEMSPPAIAPSDEPTSKEIAEVTEMEVWRELQKIQKTSPENKHA